MMIPSVIQNTKKQELYAKLKKNYSVIQNAIKLAQVQEGMVGDNRALFTPSASSTAAYDTALRFAKYVNTVKICKNKYDTGCSDVYYDVEYATEKEGSYNVNYPAIILADGSIYKITQYADCNTTVDGTLYDEIGNAVLDDEGNTQSSQWTRTYCALVVVDVNGGKKPNKFGEDVFILNVYTDKVDFNGWSPNGSKSDIRKILTNSK